MKLESEVFKIAFYMRPHAVSPLFFNIDASEIVVSIGHKKLSKKNEKILSRRSWQLLFQMKIEDLQKSWKYFSMSQNSKNEDILFLIDSKNVQKSIGNTVGNSSCWLTFFFKHWCIYM